MTWYHPDEVKAQADANQVQPEFDPPYDPTRHTSVWVGEETQELVDRWTAFKTRFDNEYNPPT